MLKAEFGFEIMALWHYGIFSNKLGTNNCTLITLITFWLPEFMQKTHFLERVRIYLKITIPIFTISCIAVKTIICLFYHYFFHKHSL